MLPGQTAQTPLMRNPLEREEQGVQTLAELKANPLWHTHFPPTRTWLFVQMLQLDPPSLVGVEPEGQIWQAPLTLPSPATQLQDWVVEL